jgi:hypothetical protein
MAQAGSCTKFQICDYQGLPLIDLIAVLFVKDASNCYHLNVVLTTGDCNALTPAIECATGETWEDAFRKAVVIDDCGNPALSIFTSSNEVT